MGYNFTDFAQLRVPDEAAADDVPADLSYIAEQLDTLTVLKAATVSERNSKFYDAPSGVLCVVRGTSSPFTVVGIYIKTSDVGTSTWQTVWEPPASLTFAPIDLNDAYTTRGTPNYDPGVWRENAVFASLKGAIVRVNGAQITSGSVVGWLPSGYLPLASASDYPVATAYHSTGGYGNAKLGTAADGTLTYYGPNTNWVGFDGIRYFLAQS